jgi:hypothetical protein
MSSSPAAAPTRARSVNGPLPQLLVGPGRLASPHVADPSPAAPRWLRLVPVRVVFLVVLALAVLLGAGLVRAVVRALTAPLGHLAAGLPPLPSGVVAGAEQFRSLLVVFPRSRRSRSQYPVDEVVDEGGGGGFALERHAHEHAAGQHRERGIDVLRVEVRVEDVPHRASARLVEPESQLTDDLTLVGTLHDTGEQTIQMALREVVGEVSEGRTQIAAQVPRGRWVLRFVADLLDGFPDEIEASRPVRIDRGLGEAGPPGDLGVSNGIPADLDEQRGGGCDDVAPRPGDARIQRGGVEICHE